MKTPNRFLLPLFIFVLTGRLSAGQIDEKSAGLSATFLETQASVRLSALGGDQAGLRGGMDSLQSNPAGLTSVSVPVLGMAYNNSFLETRYNSLNGVLPVGSNVLGLGFQYIDEGSEDRVGSDTNGDPVRDLGQFHYSTMLLKAAFAKKIFSTISVGTALQGWRDQRDGKNVNAWAADVGAQMSPAHWLDLGLAARRLGPSVEGHPLPREIAPGIAVHLPFSNASKMSGLFLSEVGIARDRKTALRNAVEIRYASLALRAGHQNLTSHVEDTLSQFSFGVGLRFQRWSLDYAWLPHAELGDQQRIGLSFQFGLTSDQAKAMAADLDQRMAARMTQRSDDYFKAAQESIRVNNWDNALDQLNQTLQWNPAHAEAKLLRDHARDQKNIQQANRLYQDAEKFAANNQWLDAALRCQQALQLSPRHKEAKALQEKALRITKRATVAKRSELDGDYEDGVRNYLNGNYDAALKNWNRVLKSQPDRTDVREYVEKAQKMQLQRKVEDLEARKHKDDQSVESMAHQAYTFYTLGQTQKAVDMWKRVLALQPENRDARLALLEAERRLKLPNGDDATTRSVVQVQELNGQALSAYSEGNISKAATLWKKALEIDPRNTWIKNNLARAEGELASAAADAR